MCSSVSLGTMSFKKKCLTGKAVNETETFHLLVGFPNGHNGRSSVRPKPRACNSILFSYVGDKDLNTWVIFSCFSRGVNRELGGNQFRWGQDMCLKKDNHVIGSGLACCATTPDLFGVVSHQSWWLEWTLRKKWGRNNEGRFSQGGSQNLEYCWYRPLCPKSVTW